METKFSKIYCSKCESDRISLTEMKCLNCGSHFKDEDIQILLKEAYDDHLKELDDNRTCYKCIKPFDVTAVDDDGFSTDKFVSVEKNSLWKLSESSSTIIGGECHLDCVDKNTKVSWIEIPREYLAETFEEVHNDQ